MTSKMTDYENSKTETITVRVPVKTYYESEVDYDEFVSEWMTDQMKGESDEDYERRTLRTWALMVEELGNEHECEEIDEGECYNQDTNPLEAYGDAEAEWRSEVKQASNEVKHRMKKEAEDLLRAMAVAEGPAPAPAPAPAPKTAEERNAELEQEVARLKALLGSKA